MKAPFRKRGMSERKIVIVGDSHVQAMQRALRKREEKPGSADTSSLKFFVYQFSRPKNGKLVGDGSVEDIVKIISKTTGNDIVVTTIGGNHHNVVGLVQHPVPFDFLEPDADMPRTQNGVQNIPYNTMLDFFEDRVHGKDRVRLSQIRDAARGAVYSLIPPPPKQDEAHILRRHEAAFQSWGIFENGISPAPLRSRLWRLHARVLRASCDELGVCLVPAPKQAVSADGFLQPQYYADDASHANAAYGELVLRQLERIALEGADIVESF